VDKRGGGKKGKKLEEPPITINYSHLIHCVPDKEEKRAEKVAFITPAYYGRVQYAEQRKRREKKEEKGRRWPKRSPLLI